MRAHLLFLALGVSACGSAPPSATTPEAHLDLDPQDLPWAETGLSRVRVPVDGAPARGARAPLVELVVFSDFECPFCRDVAPVVDRLVETYPDALRVSFRQLPMPRHRHATQAAIATLEARAAMGDEGFWAMHDCLFQLDSPLTEDTILACGQGLGLAAEDLRRAFTELRHADEVEADLALADRVGADGTPTFYLNGRPVLGALSFEAFRLLVDREIQLAEAAVAAGVPRARIYEAAMLGAAEEASRREAPPSRRPAGTGRSRELDPSVTYAVPVDGAPALGPATAPVTVVIFSDFECPFCARVNPTLRQLLSRYPDQLRFVFRHNPLPSHPAAYVAAQASQEAFAQAGDEAFWQMHDLLFANQRALRFDDLMSYADQVGLDLARFRAALENGAHEETIEADQRLAMRLGARGTPSFFLNGRPVMGAQPLPVFTAAVEEALSRARTALAAGATPESLYEALVRGASSEAVWRERVARAEFAVPTDAPRRGATEPALVVQMFTDFECPFCARAAPTVGRLLEAFPQIQVVFRHLPLPFHESAAMAALAALEVRRQLGDEGFWRMAESLFANASTLDQASLVEQAVAVGADGEEVAEAIREERHREAIVADLEAVRDSGLRIGTPTFLVGTRLVIGAQPYEVFEAAVRAELAAAAEAGGDARGEDAAGGGR